MFDAIGDAIGGALGGIGDALGGITDIAGKIMDSPLGGILSAIFPGAGAAMQGLNLFTDVLGGLSGGVGGGENY